jgi:mRNA-degrading endonuclease RelE of RelBE toxin-antitoxin system
VTQHWDLPVEDLLEQDASYLQAREQRKVLEAVAKLELNLMNPPRPHKKVFG